MPKLGRQTWEFPSQPRLLQAATVAGQLEAEGPLGAEFDVHIKESGQGDSWEQAEQKMFSQAMETMFSKAAASPGDIDLMMGGDLNAQLTSFYFAHRNLSIPALGLFSACSTITQAIALAGLSIDSGYADKVVVGTSSHTSTAERQFRYPTEYGAQKPPTAQRTVTGAGVALLGRTGGNVALTHATIGEIADYGIKSPWEMGAAMAPAAFSTIKAHLRDTGRTLTDYDCIATGDLGRMGHKILVELLSESGFETTNNLTDCGIEVYRQNQSEVFSGGSGAACCTLVLFGHFLKKLQRGEWKRILVSATGALLSSVSAQQKQSIPAVSHAIVLERKDG